MIELQIFTTFSWKGQMFNLVIILNGHQIMESPLLDS